MISIIICSYNPKEEYLNRAINSILIQTYSGEIDFFIIDNNSSHPVSLNSIVQKNRIPVFIEMIPGLTAARECGVKNARGEIIVFVDDDNILSENYIALVAEIFKNPSIGVISGTILPEYEGTPEKWFSPFASMLALRSFKEDRLFLTNIPSYSEYFPIGAGMCIRKKIIASYFSSLTNRIEGRKGASLSSGEDIDIDLYAISIGSLIGVMPELVVKHIIPYSRCTIQYLQKLSGSILISCNQINEKWKPKFHQNVFNFFDMNIPLIVMHFVVRLFLFPIKKYRIGFIHYKTMIQLRLNYSYYK